ncbi:MAG: hypothetical protein ACK4LB_02355 [Spirosomataceae bacterium]
MKCLITLSISLFIVFSGSFSASGQVPKPSTPYHASFQLTYDRTTQEYTFWLIPNYSTPNEVNFNLAESDVAAFAILLVPKDFVITQFQNLVGKWDGNNNLTKLGPGLNTIFWNSYSLLPDTYFYVLSNLAGNGQFFAPFQKGVPIPCFKFRGNGCFGDVRIFDLEDDIGPIIESDYIFPWWGNSFQSYSSIMASSQAPQSFSNHYLAGDSKEVSCSSQTEVQAKPDTIRLDPKNSVSLFPILTNDSKNNLPVLSLDANVRLLQSPPIGSLSVLPTNQIEYYSSSNHVPNFTFQYQVCLKSEPLQCDTASVFVTGYSVSDSLFGVYISQNLLGSLPDTSNNQVFQTLNIFNSNRFNFKDVEVRVTHHDRIEQVHFYSSQGEISPDLVKVNIKALPKRGFVSFSKQLNISKEIPFLFTQVDISAVTERDQVTFKQSNSFCLTIPITQCDSEESILTVPSNWTGVQWFKNDVLVGQGNTLTVQEPGRYTVKANNQNCSSNGCCSIEVVRIICCDSEVLIPSKALKTVKRRP